MPILLTVSDKQLVSLCYMHTYLRPDLIQLYLEIDRTLWILLEFEVVIEAIDCKETIYTS